MRRSVAWLLVALALAGCTGPSDAPDEGPGELRVTLRADPAEIGPGENVTVTHEATNVGTGPVRWPEGGCDAAWHRRVLQDGATVDTGPPRPSCGMPITEGVLAPGEATTATFAWNGTVFEADRYVPAPAGNYTVEATFTWFEGDAVRNRANETALRVRSG